MSLGFVGCLFNDRIPHSGDKFLIFYANWLSCAIFSTRPFWKCVRGLQASLAVLIPHCCPCLLLDLIPVRRRMFLPGKCSPTSVWPPYPATSCSFLQCYCQQSLVVITPILGWLHSYRCLRHTINISPLSSTGTHEHITWG